MQSSVAFHRVDYGDTAAAELNPATKPSPDPKWNRNPDASATGGRDRGYFTCSIFCDAAERIMASVTATP
jgi:hypothetical protein